MKAIVCDGYGSADVLKVGTRPLPVLGPGEIMIKIHYSALNRADVMQRQGQYPAGPGVTDVLGLEAVGQVVISGANTPEEKLDNRRVMALLPGGGYAQYVKVHKSNVIDIPDQVSYQDAACFTEVWATAFQLLFLVAKVLPGETVLVHAAASGVGTAMIQLAGMNNIKTIAVASSDDKLAVCT